MSPTAQVGADRGSRSALPASLASPSRWKRIRNRVLFRVISAMLFWIGWWPRRCVDAMAVVFGTCGYWMHAPLRRRAEKRLAQAGAPGTARAAFVAALAMVGDTARLWARREEAAARLELREPQAAALRAAAEEGRGVICISAHLGPFERVAAVIAEAGFDVTTLARNAFDAQLAAWIKARRARYGVTTLDRAHPLSALAAERRLLRGHLLAFVVDLPARGARCIDVQVGGRRTALPLVGPATVALRTGAPIRLVFAHRPCTSAEAEGSNARDAIAVLPVESADLSPGDEEALAARIADALDGAVKGEPWRWLGVFDAPRGTSLRP